MNMNNANAGPFNAFWRMEVQRQLQSFTENDVINKEKCANMIADLTPGGKKLLVEHQKDYGEILLHLLAGDLISEPLIELLKYHADRADDIEMYCKAIEMMWRNGDDYVVNVVDVTILERLSDEECIWQRFGTFISDEFKEYINKEVLPNNLMMGGVKELRLFEIPIDPFYLESNMEHLCRGVERSMLERE